MSLYTCPFCKQEIQDGIDSLIEHRKQGGDCEQNQISYDTED